ncbi:hypothetical protein BV898_08360 [Hypsibius exemplaris]|uniref:G-protein coupled receptors family 1 profile domain-containing protein n=1 Tax=Hypsibius exemplaris TaxID=2072580 RepID=A0A1W0WQV9_HYPEX|nr:hypothetical protein BV898_08360 [Hypsibius exemplaris]
MPGVHDCWATFVVEWGSKAHVSWFAVSIFIIPTSILTATFARAIWTGLKLHRHDANAGSLQPDDSASLEGRSHTNLTQDPQEYVGHSYSELSPGIARRLNIRNKLLREKLIAAFIVCYICCWTPFISLLLYTTFHPTRRVNVSTFNILTFLTKLHICANPWIYLVFVVVKIGRYARGGSGRNWMGTLEEQDLVTSSGLNTEMDLQEPRTGRVWHREEFGRG